ncbi:hypothetical protein RF11_10653 [Thelohanellus kitauei]|uniref:Uncharacterized protein n=1 Tax=Thelohanellus kitauei TaxID=669202 RepID=A0A0C2N6Y8_THEKT|nr:hypothetical protein RF11_10653 [Thelohanellus kitauei]
MYNHAGYEILLFDISELKSTIEALGILKNFMIVDGWIYMLNRCLFGRLHQSKRGKTRPLIEILDLPSQQKHIRDFLVYVYDNKKTVKIGSTTFKSEDDSMISKVTNELSDLWIKRAIDTLLKGIFLDQYRTFYDVESIFRYEDNTFWVI